MVRCNLPHFFEWHLDDVRAVPSDACELRLGGRVGHDRGAGYAVPVRVPRESLGHVPAATGVHAFRPLFGRKEFDCVTCSSDLERTCRLQVLELEIDVRVTAFEIEGDERCSDDQALQSLLCIVDVPRRYSQHAALRDRHSGMAMAIPR